MAKKGKKKGGKSRKLYSKKTFKEVFCQSCGICQYKRCNPIFCYSELYKSNPDTFIKAIFPALKELADTLITLGRPPSAITPEPFAETVCDSGICLHKCKTRVNLNSCYKKFREQTSGRELTEDFAVSVKRRSAIEGLSLQPPPGQMPSKSRRKGRKNRKKIRYVCRAYPSFFVRKDPEFEDFVKRTLHENNYSESDKDRKSAKEA